MSIKPLRMDPTRTGLIRKAWLREFVNRLRRIKAAIRDRLTLALNVFCPTGPGGGIDPTCSPGKGVSAEATKLVKGYLHKLPQSVRRHVKSVQIVGKLSEAGLTGSPRGHGPGATWDNAPGVHRADGSIIVATSHKDLVTREMRPVDLLQVLPHEVGHAFDLAEGVSSSTEFKAAYDKDVKALSPEDRRLLRYYVQPGKAGLEETAASAFSAATGGKVHSSFLKMRNTIAHVKRVVSPVANAQTRLNPDKLQAFNQWLEQMLDQGFLDKRGGGEVPWTLQWTERAYKTGLARSYTKAQKKLRAKEIHEAGLREFSNRTAKVTEAQVRILASRAYEDLKGISAAMSAAISRELVNGALSGLTNAEIANAIDAQVDKIGLNRARALVEDAVTRAYSEAMLDGLEDQGVTQVGVDVEWHTTGQPCKLCAPLAGARFTIEQARGLFPRHPFCKCVPVPTDEGIDIEETREALEESVDEETGHSGWAGQSLLNDLEEG